MKSLTREIMEILEAFDATGWPIRRPRWRWTQDCAPVWRQSEAGEPVDGPVRSPGDDARMWTKIEGVETSQGICASRC